VRSEHRSYRSRERRASDVGALAERFEEHCFCNRIKARLTICDDRMGNPTLGIGWIRTSIIKKTATVSRVPYNPLFADVVRRHIWFGHVRRRNSYIIGQLQRIPLTWRWSRPDTIPSKEGSYRGTVEKAIYNRRPTDQKLRRGVGAVGFGSAS
jgi:hypothetical protein